MRVNVHRNQVVLWARFALFVSFCAHGSGGLVASQERSAKSIALTFMPKCTMQGMRGWVACLSLSDRYL